MSGGRTITVSKVVHEKLQTDLKNALKSVTDYKNKLSKVIKELDATKAKLDETTKEFDDADKEVVSFTDQVKQLEEDNGKMANWIDKARDQIKALQGIVTEQEEALRKSGAGVTSNRKSDMVGHVIEATTTFLFRKWKFIEDEADLALATEEVIPYLAVDKELPEDTFITLYKDVVQKSLSEYRGYIQAECKKRAKGTHLSCPIHSFFV